MGTRLLRRFRSPVLGAIALVLSTGLWAAPATAAVPPQEPGVTLRVFDVQTPRGDICRLKAGQTPNIDKLMPVVDWSSTADFGLADNFLAHVLGNVNITIAGSYTFRITSDEGSRLFIDNALLIDHDGLHGPTPREGTVRLAPGYHTLRIEYFERDGGQRLTFDWRVPGSSSFALVPHSVLSTDAGVVRVTAPGKKDCESPGDSPGDGRPLTGVHPSYTLTNLRPDGFEPQVTGMDWLPDGRLLIATWGGTNNSAGDVYVLTNTGGSTEPGRVTTKKIASKLKEPMGLKVVDGVVYVSEKQRLTRLVDTNGDEVIDRYDTVATWPYGTNFHEFAFGLLYRDGFFYLNLSVAINSGGATTDPQPAPNRGTTIRVNKDTGEASYMAGGLRTPHGIGWGPENGIFVTDNQGGWLPSSKLLHVKQGRFFNHYMNPAGPFDAAPPTPPVLWMPQNEIANSPSAPLLLQTGVYAGQFLIGDVTYGGLQRAHLEKVNGEYQGALFRLTQGLEVGISEVHQGPDGAIYVAGLGTVGSWSQAGKLKHGLQKLMPNGASTFDIRAMRATATGFEMEYTQPLSAATAANLVARYKFKQWRYQPTAAYGGPKLDEETLAVTSATLSADGKKVNLVVNGRKAGRVVYVRSPRPFTSASGQSLWSTEAWYTLNAIPGGTSPTTNVALNKPATADSSCTSTEGPAKAVNGSVSGGNNDKWCSRGTNKYLQVDLGANHNVNKFVVKHAGAGRENTTANTRDFTIQTSLDGATWTTRATVTGNTASTTTHDIAAATARHVRLNITVPTSTGDKAARIYEFEVYGAPSGGGGGSDRIQLFDGTSLANWSKTNGSPATWPISGGSMEVLGGDIRSKQDFGDFKLHVEFWLPNLPPDVTGQRRANSGVYLQNRYEIQVLDTFGKPTLTNSECASIYAKRAPDSNAGTAPETWQTYDITFRAARFNGTTKTENARVTVVWNGTTVHNNVVIDGPTGGGSAEGPSGGPIRLQDHGDPGPNNRYRNIWIEPLS
jgi:glucose/arabinose dehydrogenase